MTTTRNKAADKEPPASRPCSTLTPEEIARGRAFYNKLAEKPPTFKSKKTPSGRTCMEVEDTGNMPACMRLAEMVGSVHPAFQKYIVDQIVATFPGFRIATDQGSTGIDEQTMVNAGNVAMTILNVVRPRDELEALLAAQMIGVHNLAMHCQQRALHPSQTSEGLHENIASATKLIRTFQSQMETLERYRNGVHQTVEVKHVHVEGDQTPATTSETTADDAAASGNTSDGRQPQEDHTPAERQSAGQSHERAPVRSQDPPRHPVPGSRNGKRAVSHARRKEHWAPNAGRSRAMPPSQP